MGDFNLNLLNFSNDTSVTRFLDLTQSSGLLPTITIPTRITNHSATLIDNIFSNNIVDPFFTGVLTEPISDHLITAYTTFFPGEVPSPDFAQYSTRLFTEKSINAFKHDLNKSSFLPDNRTDVNSTYNFFSNKFKLLYEKHFPIKTFKQKVKYKKNPWITTEIIDSCRQKAKLYKNFLINPTTENECIYKDFNRIHCKTLKSAKKKYIEIQLSSALNNIKETWKVLNNLLGRGRQKNNIQSLISGNKLITNPSEIADAFNKHFASVGEKLDAAIPAVENNVKDFYSEPTAKSLFLSPCNSSEINFLILVQLAATTFPLLL